MSDVTEAMVEAAVRAECAFDKSDYDAMSRPNRERYFARTRAALEAAQAARESEDDAQRTMRHACALQVLKGLKPGEVFPVWTQPK